MRRPWNTVNFPVYSLSTRVDDVCNMNICTYVTPISMKPKMYSIGLYYNTKSLENMEKSQFAVLQFLNQDQYKLVNVLGKKSGFKYDKEQYLTKKDLLTEWQGFKVLKDANAYLLLEKKGSIDIEGDHKLFWFDMKKSKAKTDKGHLHFDDLVTQKIIL